MISISNDLTNSIILKELGQRIRCIRIDQNITQRQLAEESGISLNTLSRLETGFPVGTDNLLAVMRVLDLLENLETVFPKSVFHPMDAIAEKRKQKKRASRKRINIPKKDWKWNDEV